VARLGTVSPCRGTEGSNPLPSSEESVANLTSGKVPSQPAVKNRRNKRMHREVSTHDPGTAMWSRTRSGKPGRN
jgi:hypothetical protein